jgi:hypothetical protein
VRTEIFFILVINLITRITFRFILVIKQKPFSFLCNNDNDLKQNFNFIFCEKRKKKGGGAEGWGGKSNNQFSLFLSG